MQEILELQADLLDKHQKLLGETKGEFLETLDKILDDPETMFIGLDVLHHKAISGIVSHDKNLSQKVKLLSEPSVDALASAPSEKVKENIQLALLVKKAIETESASLEELGKYLGCSGDAVQTTKAVQKLIMKAIQLNLLNATIDKKINKVYFL